MKWNLRYCLIVVYNKIVLTKTYQYVEIMFLDFDTNTCQNLMNQ